MRAARRFGEIRTILQLPQPDQPQQALARLEVAIMLAPKALNRLRQVSLDKTFHAIMVENRQTQSAGCNLFDNIDKDSLTHDRWQTCGVARSQQKERS